ncbi:PEGA domain-containing protein [Butyrivibrio fibrisolvens DSM 3071]|uniref:PEGA domain-containing protein n=1 Tax=Butyrivibrio fibrisolvens DSM 3071 TaxID=1121131 RepID=A0A1M5ZYU3_BUTFI|nr:PEGA domain-containing protein [Butyrivibrio fibrisolvens]SHI29316.1 PEGA domain-containing protein [Butyrivibrio fibrisolvens DSM 3071]
MRNFFRKTFTVVITLAVAIAFFPAGFIGQTVSYAQTVNTVSLVGKYDSSDLAIIKSVDTEGKTITFRNIDTGRDYTLSYDNTTFIYSEYGRALSAALLEVGEIADITFLSGSRHLNTLDISADAFSIERSYGYDLQAGPETAQIGTSYYHITDRSLVLIDGKAGRIADVLPGDSIKVSGVGTEIYCVEVKQGHGYVSLSSSMIGDESISGAYLEIGERNVYRVTDGMLVSVPEGTYQLYLTGKGVDYETTITVDRDKETIVDTSQIEIEYNYGLVTFTVVPAEARLYVDGEEINPAWPIELTYGTHKIEATAEGYLPCSEYLHVGSSKAEVEITLPVDEDYKKEEDTSTTAASIDNTPSNDSANDSSKETNNSNNSSTGKSKTKTKTPTAATTAATVKPGTLISGYYVRITAPKGVEVYLDPDKNKKDDDGTYIGITPCSFTKITGDHVIRLKKEGYLTKDYTISIDSEKKDKEYAFEELKVDPAAAASTASTEEPDGTKIEGYGVYVDAPYGSTLYVDGEEVGSVPCSFDKVKGSHTITLTRDGYVTKSYSVYIDGNKKDKVYEFPALERNVDVYALDGTEVYIDGESIGVIEDGNPVSFTKVPDSQCDGPSTIKLELEDYKTIEEEINVSNYDGVDSHYYADRQEKESSGEDDPGSGDSSDSASTASTDSSEEASTGSSSDASDSDTTGERTGDEGQDPDDNSGSGSQSGDTGSDDSTSASSNAGGTTENGNAGEESGDTNQGDQNAENGNDTGGEESGGGEAAPENPDNSTADNENDANPDSD